MHFFRLARFLLFTLIFRGKRGEGSSFKNVRSSIRNINSFLEISTRGNGKCYCLASLFSILSECFFFFFNNLKKTVSILGYKNSRAKQRLTICLNNFSPRIRQFWKVKINLNLGKFYSLLFFSNETYSSSSFQFRYKTVLEFLKKRRIHVRFIDRFYYD